MARNFEIIRGQIERLKVTRASENFLFTARDRTAMGATAVLAGVAGLAGQAVSLSASASDTSESADYLEFEIGSQSIKGWVWRNPFSDGDEVEAVVEKSENNYVAYAVLRPKDRIIAIHPHCTRGQNAHYQAAKRLWLKCSFYLGLVGFLTALLVGFFDNEGLNTGWLLFSFLCCLTIPPIINAYFAWRIASRFSPFVRLSEQIFATLGWERPADVDLYKLSKVLRKADDIAGVGTYHHRY